MKRGRAAPAAAGALFVVAVACFVLSLTTSPHIGRLLGSGTRGPVSTAPLHRARLVLPRWLGGAPSSGTIAVGFSFRDGKPGNGQVLFRSGDAASGASVRVVGPIRDEWYVVLELTPWPDHPLEAVLVSHLIAGHRYSVRVEVKDTRRVTGWVGGGEVFSYSAPAATVTTLFSDLVVGSGRSRAELARPFPADPRGVSISGLTLSYASYENPGTPTRAMALRVAAGLAASGSFVLGLLAFFSSRVLAALELAPRRRASTARLVASFWRRSGLVGVVLAIAGGTVLQLATPPEDVVVQQSSISKLAVVSVRAGRQVHYYLAGEPRIARSASAIDVRLAFQVRVSRTPSSAVPATAVSTKVAGTGMSVLVNAEGQLQASLPILAQQNVDGFALTKHLRRGRWAAVELDLVRGQSLQALVDNNQVYAYTYSSPVFGGAPTGLVIGSRGSGIAVRDLVLSTVLYASPNPGTSVLLVRLAQIAGFLFVAGGAVLVSRRVFAAVVPKAAASRPLVLVTFGVAALGITANLLVDQLRLQHSPIRFLPRNTWLFAGDARFSDFLQTFEMLRSLHPYGIQAGSYPPVGYFLLAPFVAMSQYAALFSFLALFIGFFGWWLWRSFAGAARGVEVLLVLCVAFASYPVSFGIDRANVDLLVLVAVLVAVGALEQRADRLAAPLLGLAAAAKIFPALYVLLFLRKGRWRYGVLAGVTALGATLASFLGVAGSLSSNLAGFRSGLGLVKALYANGVASTLSSSTLSSWAQSIGYAIGGTLGAQSVARVTGRLVFPEEIVGAVVLGWYVARRERELWRSVTLLTVGVLILPQVSYAYDLLYLFAPLALFVRHATPRSATVRIAVLFGLVLAPKVFFYLGDNLVDSSVLVTAPLLASLAAAVVHDGWSERRAEAKERLAAGTVTGPDSVLRSDLSVEGRRGIVRQG